MIRRLLLFLVCLFFSVPALADAIGDECSTDQVQAIPVDATQGSRTRIFCKIFAPLKGASTSGTPAADGPYEFDLTSLGDLPGLPKYSLPDELAFKLVLNDCTAGTFTPWHAETSGGLAQSFSGNPTIGLAAGGAGYITNKGEPFGPILVWTTTAVAGCVNGFEVIVMGFDINRGK